MLDLEGIKIVEGKIFICREFFSIWLYWCQRNENDRTCVHMYILRSSEVWRGKCKCHKDAVGGRPIRWNQRKCVEPQGREGDPKMQRTCAVPLEDFIFHFSPGTIPEELWNPRPSESEYSTQSVAWSFESARQWKREPFSVSGSSRINSKKRKAIRSEAQTARIDVYSKTQRGTREGIVCDPLVVVLLFIDLAFHRHWCDYTMTQ